MDINQIKAELDMEPTKSPSPTLNAMLSAMGDVSAIMAGSPTNSISETTSSGIPTSGLLPNGKKTKGRVKIKMEYIGNKLRRYTTFSKRKTGIMKKAYELSTLTGTQVMLLVASETGHVYTFATKKLNPMITSDPGKALIQQCLSQPDDPDGNLAPNRSEFTFDMGSGGARKRRGPAMGAQSGPSSVMMSSPMESDNGLSSFLPTMVPTALFQQYTDEDYQEDSDASDSEETTAADDIKSEEIDRADEEKEKDISATLQQTLKEALRAAASNRQTIAAAKKRKLAAAASTPPMQSAAAANASLANLLTPFLLAASALPSPPDVATATAHFKPSPGSPFSSPSSSTPNLVYSGPQGVVYAPDEPEGGAGATGLLGAKADELAAQRLLASFPFNFNLQQLMENSVLSSGKE